MKIFRIFVEKKPEFADDARRLLQDLRENLSISELRGLRLLNRYDVTGVAAQDFQQAKVTIFSEPPLDLLYEESFPLGNDEIAFGVEYHPGQYDQRADSAEQCLRLLAPGAKPLVHTARIVVLRGALPPERLERSKGYLINPVDSRETAVSKPPRLEVEVAIPPDVEILSGFRFWDAAELTRWREEAGLAMSHEDLLFCQQYFRNEERDPSVTEMRLLDTYWSDHCRHTTFLTGIQQVDFEPGRFNEPVRRAYDDYRRCREALLGAAAEKPVSLMEIAQMGMRELRRRGKLSDLEDSGEINACSIVVTAAVNGQAEEWLVMFKNETHNHPTEIEPFGGAATCLGGAIRDPLSGRAFVYQAMRVSGSGDPRVPVAETLPGKLPQRKITREAAQGFSSYGNQVGLATGQVVELYHPGYVAKRMEIGAVIGAVPRRQVIREVPLAGDVVLLVGGETGRDGIGGATGSSKAHTDKSLATCSAEVQKGNPVIERKIQRLFRNPEVTRIIKRCNDFGAGGVAVAVGELADGLEIDLDAVPKKYEGLDGTELALSESQERMAVVVAAEQVENFRELATAENLDVFPIAVVTASDRIVMKWRGKTIVSITRTFLNSRGVSRGSAAVISAPPEEKNYFRALPAAVTQALPDIQRAWLAALAELNVCGQRGLVERFDSNIGAGSVLLPLGGEFQSTPAEAMVAKLPVSTGATSTGTLMSFGFDPWLSSWSPFHGAVYAVVEAVARAVATGADPDNIRLSLQEYFERLDQDSRKWGKPLAALLGAFHAQMQLEIPAIGGKDSMSGSFQDLSVPPTLVAFAVAVVDVREVISPEFKRVGSQVVLLPLVRDSYELPDFTRLRALYRRVHQGIHQGHILSAHALHGGGLAEALSKMCFGNRLGLVLLHSPVAENLFRPDPGSLVVEVSAAADEETLFAGCDFVTLGQTQQEPCLRIDGLCIAIDEAQESWERPLADLFPNRLQNDGFTSIDLPMPPPVAPTRRRLAKANVAKPRVTIAVFPGSNREYDSASAFDAAGAIPETFVFRNRSATDIKESIIQLADRIQAAQIFLIPGGFSAGDEPDGSGKFIAAVLRHSRVCAAIFELLEKRDGLILGICNGFQALLKVGLLPYGHIGPQQANSPTLTYNRIGRHVARLVRTRVVATHSPWLELCRPGEIHLVPVSHGEGRFVAERPLLEKLMAAGQVAFQYVDFSGEPSDDFAHNPNGSLAAIEGIVNPDGRILGKMGHSESHGPFVYRNVPGEKEQNIFAAGVAYFR